MIPANVATMTLADVRRWYAHNGEQIEEAFNPAQARYPKGHPKAGQWRPKLAAAATGRRSKGWMDKDLEAVRSMIGERLGTTWEDGKEVPLHQTVYRPDQLKQIGKAIEKVAGRYSTSDAYKERLAAISEERKKIQDAHYEVFNEDHNAWWERREAMVARIRADFPDADWESVHYEAEHRVGTSPNLSDYVSAADSDRLAQIADEEIRLHEQAEKADRDALMGVLTKLRPFGGKPLARGEYSVDEAVENDQEPITRDPRYEGNWKMLQSDLDSSLKEVTKHLPRDWIESINDAGSVSFEFSNRRAFHRLEQPPMNYHRKMEAAVDAALAGKLDETNITRTGLIPRPESLDVQDHHTPEWDRHREAITAEQQRIAAMRFEWVGREQSRNHPGGLWPVLRAEDGKLWWANWGGEFTPFAGDESTIIKEPRQRRDFPGGPKINSTIRTDPRDTDTLAHEVLHRVEALRGRMLNSGYRPLNLALVGFHQERTKGDSTVLLREHTGNNAYEDDEVTKPDEFFDPYVGKIYPGRTIREGGDTANRSGEVIGGYTPTEVLTMGVQYLWWPHWKRKLDNDEDMRHFIIGTLGAL